MTTILNYWLLVRYPARRIMINLLFLITDMILVLISQREQQQQCLHRFRPLEYLLYYLLLLVQVLFVRCCHLHHHNHHCPHQHHHQRRHQRHHQYLPFGLLMLCLLRLLVYQVLFSLRYHPLVHLFQNLIILLCILVISLPRKPVLIQVHQLLLPRKLPPNHHQILKVIIILIILNNLLIIPRVLLLLHKVHPIFKVIFLTLTRTMTTFLYHHHHRLIVIIIILTTMTTMTTQCRLIMMLL
mmetsp:Transcript_22423/g.25533  ORF Transcript_22423/g.25533 Transcript_22423/m.25533 type:complete len:241 (-) Transcript_22423:1472-2194(-)